MQWVNTLVSALSCYFSTAICTPVCDNGGTCTSPGVCTCATGWSGSRCKDRESLDNTYCNCAQGCKRPFISYPIQLSVAQGVLTEVVVLLLTHVPVFLNGLDPLVPLVSS